MLPSEVPRLTTDSAVRVFPGVWKLPSFLRLPSRMNLHPYHFCLSFYLLYFFLPPFKDNALLFWVPDGGKNTQKNCTKKIFMTQIITMV